MSDNPYEKAYLREKLARQSAEDLLETKSRDLFISNTSLQEQNKEIKKQIATSDLLLKIDRYGHGTVQLKDFMLEFLDAVCCVDGWPLAHFYFDSEEQTNRWGFGDKWFGQDRDEFLKNVSSLEFDDLNSQKFFSDLCHVDKCWIPNLSTISSVEFLSNSLRDILVSMSINALLIVPIKRYERVRAIAKFYFYDESDADPALIKSVVAAASQLGALVEKRYSEENLKENHQKLQDTLDTLQQAQVQLLQSEKMASLGQLAAGVAHEINNPIGFVKSNVNSLKEYCGITHSILKEFRECQNLWEKFLSDSPSGDETEKLKELLVKVSDLDEQNDLDYILEDTHDLLQESFEGIDQVSGIVKNLKGFSRLDENEVKPADLHEGIEQTIKMVWSDLKYKCTLEKEYGDIPLVSCYPAQLNQVFLNLLVNAAQAITKDGVIRIRTYFEGDIVFLSFSDTGSGISEENMSKLFTPFFTTKPVGKGTGLGLSVSYNIVEKHGGEISVKSVLGEGTCFTVCLPANYLAESLTSNDV